MDGNELDNVVAGNSGCAVVTSAPAGDAEAETVVTLDGGKLQGASGETELPIFVDQKDQNAASLGAKETEGDTSGATKDTEAGIAAPQPVSDEPLPDKTLRAWLAVFACFSAHVFGIGYAASWGVFQRTLLLDSEFTGLTNFNLSYAGTILFGTALFTGIFVGALADRFPIPLLMLIGTTIMCGALIANSFARELWNLYCSQALFGIGASMVMMPTTAVVPTWFVKHRALAMGISVSGTGIGAFIITAVSQACISASGWRLAMRVLAGICFVWLCIAASVVKRRIAVVPRKGPLITFVYFRNEVFTLIFCSVLVLMLNFFTPQIYIPLMLRDGGYSDGTGAAIVSVFSAMVALGRIIGGFLADRVGELNMFAAGCAVPLFATLAIWMPAPTNLGTTAAASVLWAVFCGAPLVTMPVISVQEFGVARLGAVIGVLYLSFGPGEIVGPSLCGLIIDRATSYSPTGQRLGADYRGFLAFAASTWFVALVLIWILRWKKVGWKLLVRI